jgi:hypothetical protein
MTMEQMMLFEKPTTEFDSLWEAVHKLKSSHDKVRKRLFKELKDLECEITKLRAENERIKFHTNIGEALTCMG